MEVVTTAVIMEATTAVAMVMVISDCTLVVIMVVGMEEAVEAMGVTADTEATDTGRTSLKHIYQ